MAHDDTPSNNPFCKCMDLWLTILTKAPLCVCVVQLAICIAMSVIGIMSSIETYGVPFQVDLDFGNYLGATTELYMFSEAQAAAHAQQAESMLDPKTSSRRMLVADTTDFYHEMSRDLASTSSTSEECKKSVKNGKSCIQSRWHWSLNLYYRPKNRCHQGADVCMFAEEILMEIKDFEQSLRDVSMNDNGISSYDDFCLKTKDSYAGSLPHSCRPIDTVNMIFFAEDDGFDGHVMSGNATKMREKKEAVDDLVVRTPMHWLTDKYFSALNRTDPEVLRSRMVGGLPLKGFPSATKDFQAQVDLERTYLTKLLNDVLLPANEKYKHLHVNWEESNVGLTSIEVLEELKHDSMYALGSVLFVGVLVLSHTMSLTLTICAAVGILLSFPMAFACYWWCGFRTMKLLNFVSLFLIMGIGADDVFVFYDTFHQGKAVKGEESRISTRFKWAYKHAGGAMLVTTATTCGSFFANAVSEVAVVREFGVFMGFVVLFNYINVMTLFPAALLLNEYFMDRCCAKDQDPEGNAAGAAGGEKKKKGRVRLKRHSTTKSSHGPIQTSSLSAVERCFHGCFTSTIWSGRYFWIFLGIFMSVLGTWAGFTFFKPLSGQPQIFVKERNQGGLDEYKYNHFVTMSDDVIHQELAQAIKPNSEYKSATQATEEANAETGTLIPVLSCTINPNLGNLGPNFNVDEQGTYEKLFSIKNNGNATGTWTTSVDASSWVTLSPGSGGSSINGETKQDSSSNVRLVYTFDDSILERGNTHRTNMKVKNSETGQIICAQDYVVTRRLAKPGIEAATATLEIDGGANMELDMIPTFEPTVKSYTINVKQEVQTIYLKLLMLTTRECGDACLYDQLSITRWKEVEGTSVATVRYDEDTKYTNYIDLLGGDLGGELTKVTVTMSYDFYNE